MTKKVDIIYLTESEPLATPFNLKKLYETPVLSLLPIHNSIAGGVNGIKNENTAGAHTALFGS